MDAKDLISEWKQSHSPKSHKSLLSRHHEMILSLKNEGYSLRDMVKLLEVMGTKTTFQNLSYYLKKHKTKRIEAAHTAPFKKIPTVEEPIKPNIFDIDETLTGSSAIKRIKEKMSSS
jgi:hypothetical protein